MDDGIPGKGVTKLERGAQVLREAILRGDLQPGQKLKQQELAEWLGMSATPVREVLRILEAEGLLFHDPYKGVFVAEVSMEDSAEITPIRVALEGLAVRMAVPRLGEEEITALVQLVDEMQQAWQEVDLAQVRRANYSFHATLYRAAGSRILLTMIERLWPRFATELLWMIPHRTERSIEQHRAILQAVRDRDAEKAAKLLEEHITTAGRSIAEFTSRQSVLSPQEVLETDAHNL
jgi:DNA-binding GntR family transcriptional regulator